MCGIYGFIGFKDDKLLSQMGECLAHRGPDDQDFYQKDLVNFGYRRLSIIDVKKSFQPLFNEDKSIILLFNGEIYNFQELREKLPKHKFVTDGDGETIIHWYEEHGVAGLKDLNGMFAISLYDTKKQKVYLIRDHFGIKPLYYSTRVQPLSGIIFASEIKAILKKIKAKPNDKIIQKYLLTRAHDDTEETFFKNINRVPSGSFLEWDVKTGQHQIKRFFDLARAAPANLKNENLINRFRELFLDSIRLRLISEVPVGTALSGGLDSSAIVCAVPQLKTFSAVFPNQINNEEKYIDEVVKKTGATAFKIYPNPSEFWSEIEKLIYHQDEPMISTGPYAQWKVMEKAHTEGIKVIIDGQGADEMLAGYTPYHFVYFRELFNKKEYLKLFKELLFSIDLIWPLVKDKFKSRVNIKDLFVFAGLHPAKQGATLKERLKRDFFSTSLPSLLRYEDHNSMAFSIESRVPFLDYRLVELVFSLPPNFIIRNGWNKWIMRQALKGILPEIIRNRRWKVGFTTPEVAWLRETAAEVRKIFNSESFNHRPYFNHDKIRESFENFVAGKNDESMIFWRIINLELWLRIFID
ncbi:MAG: asparagine synthase (glutamine-hydrolyzing) [Patescibacteria group bacterium]